MLKYIAIPALVLTAAITTACDGAAAFRSAVPTKNQVQMRVPGGTAGALSQALSVGEQADFYKSTVDIATSVNGGVLWVFDVIDFILAHPPTTVDENTAVWGPTEPKGLEKLSIKFTVVKIEEGHFTYKLEARPKGETSDDAFITAFEGEAFPAADDKGTGTLTYHLGSLRSLDDTQCLLGDIDVAYDASSEPRTLDVTFHQVANDCQQQRPTDAHYTYAENEDKSGTMDFAFRTNMHKPEENKPLEEVMSVRSRWLTTGEGRSDVQVAEGEIPGDLAQYIPGTTATTVDMVECWDGTFNMTYQDTNPDELEPHLGHENAGDVSSCVFADAEFASL